jgi:hypothetical protein
MTVLGDLTGSRPSDQARLRGLGGPRFDPDRMLVPVEQVDREAAADLGRDFLHWTARQCDITRNGEGDQYPVVQALAKHRIETNRQA